MARIMTFFSNRPPGESYAPRITRSWPTFPPVNTSNPISATSDDSMRPRGLKTAPPGPCPQPRAFPRLQGMPRYHAEGPPSVFRFGGPGPFCFLEHTRHTKEPGHTASRFCQRPTTPTGLKQRLIPFFIFQPESPKRKSEQVRVSFSRILARTYRGTVRHLRPHLEDVKT